MAIGAISTTLIVVQAVLLTDIVVSVFVEGDDLASLSLTISILVGVVLIRAGLSYLSERLAFRSSAKAKEELRIAVMRHSMELGPVWLSSRNSAQLTQLVTRGIDGLDAYFARYLPQLILAVLVPIGVGAVILTQDLLAAVIVVCTLPLIPVFMILIGLYTERRVDRQWRVLAVLSGHFADVVSGMPTLKIFGRARAQARSVREVGDEYRRTTMGVLRISFISALVLELLAMLSVAMVAVSIGVRLVEGSMTLSAGLLVLIIVPEVYLPLRLVGMHYHASAEGLGAAQQMIEIIETPTVTSGRNTEVPDLSQCSIKFEQVTVAYPSRPANALTDFSCTIAPNSLTILSGPSGSGKSTALAVLERFVDPLSGRVLIEGEMTTPLDAFHADEWRSKIAWLGQDERPLPVSVRANVAFGNPDASDDEIRAALTAVGLSDQIEELVDGVDTLIAADGSGLSVGQQRRMLMARVLCRPAQLVLLDEPLAALDLDSRTILARVITELAQTRTVVVASHHDDLTDSAAHVVNFERVSR